MLLDVSFNKISLAQRHVGLFYQQPPEQGTPTKQIYQLSRRVHCQISNIYFVDSKRNSRTRALPQSAPSICAAARRKRVRTRRVRGVPTWIRFLDRGLGFLTRLEVVISSVRKVRFPVPLFRPFEKSFGFRFGFGFGKWHFLDRMDRNLNVFLSFFRHKSQFSVIFHTFFRVFRQFSEPTWDTSVSGSKRFEKNSSVSGFFGFGTEPTKSLTTTPHHHSS